MKRITTIWLFSLLTIFASCQHRYWFRNKNNIKAYSIASAQKKVPHYATLVSKTANASFKEPSEELVINQNKHTTTNNTILINKPRLKKRANKSLLKNQLFKQTKNQHEPDPEKAKNDTRKAWRYLLFSLFADFFTLFSFSLGGFGIFIALTALTLSFLSISKSISAIRNNPKNLFLPILAILLVLFFVFIMLAETWALFDSANA